MAVIEVRGLTKRFGSVLALDQLSFDVEQGTVVGFLGVRWLRDQVHGLAAEGAAVLVSSHLLAEVAQTVNSVVILDHGRLVTQAPLADLMADAKKVIRVRTQRPEELRDALAVDGADAQLVAPDRVEITGSTTSASPRSRRTSRSRSSSPSRRRPVWRTPSSS